MYFSRYSKRTTSTTPTCQKLAFQGKLSLRYYIAQLCTDDSIQILLNLTWV